MKKIFLLIILLFIASCARKEFSPEFHTGTEGLKLEFLENSPPDEILYIKDSPSQFLIGIGLRNKGAEDIDNGFIRVASFKNYAKIMPSGDCIKAEQSSNFPNIIKCDLPELKGKSFESAEGDFIPIYLDAELNTDEILKAEKGINEFLDNIDIEAEYDYATTSSLDICINDIKDIFNLKKSCKAKTEILSGQGGPVAVSKIEYSTSRIASKDKNNQNLLTLVITFEDKGTKYDKVVNDEIKLEEISFSDYSTNDEVKKIDCKGLTDDKIKMKKETGNENKIACTAFIDKSPEYLAKLVVRFSYRYYTKEKKIIKIKKVMEELIEGERLIPAPFEETKIGEFCSKASPNFDSDIQYNSKKYSVDPCLIMAMISVESNFKPEAVSRAGAIGLMQITPATADTLNIDKNKLNEPGINIEGGTRNLRDNYNKFKGKYNEIEATRMAIAAHNAGPTGVQKIIDNYGSNWFEHLPYETKNFVPCVDYCWKEFKDKGTCNKNNNQYCKNLLNLK